jgi:hypothetical protein
MALPMIGVVHIGDIVMIPHYPHVFKLNSKVD